MSVTIELPDIAIGAKYEHTFAWSTVASNGVLTPADLTGFSARLQIAQLKAGDMLPIADWKTVDMAGGGQITIVDNKFVVAVNASVTAALKAAGYVFGLLAWPTATPEDADLVATGTVRAVKVPVSLPTP
jgi:hypothetical protein